MIRDWIIENNKCVICEEYSDKKVLCPNCYKSYKKFYDNNENLSYCNKNIKYALLKLFAYFDLLEENEREEDKTEFLIDFAQYIQPLIKQQESNNIEYDIFTNETEEVEDYRKKYPANIRCKDGHYVRSEKEKTIDDRLYEKGILHEYEKRYKGVNEQIYYPDFYIPKANLYIEYFGMTNENEKNELKKKIYLKDKNLKFEFIYHTKGGILDDIIDDIIEKYKL